MPRAHRVDIAWTNFFYSLSRPTDALCQMEPTNYNWSLYLRPKVLSLDSRGHQKKSEEKKKLEPCVWLDTYSSDLPLLWLYGWLPNSPKDKALSHSSLSHSDRPLHLPHQTQYTPRLCSNPSYACVLLTSLFIKLAWNYQFECTICLVHDPDW